MKRTLHGRPGETASHLLSRPVNKGVKRRATPSPTSSLSGRPARKNTLNQRLQQRRASEEPLGASIAPQNRSDLVENGKGGNSKDSRGSKDPVTKGYDNRKTKMDRILLERQSRSTRRREHVSGTKENKNEDSSKNLEVNGESSDDTVDP